MWGYRIAGLNKPIILENLNTEKKKVGTKQNPNFKQNSIAKPYLKPNPINNLYPNQIETKSGLNPISNQIANLNPNPIATDQIS